MPDVIVVGARCAGAATALLLAERGWEVLLLDRAAPGSDTLSTLYIHPPGVAKLLEWGVVPSLDALGVPPVENIDYRVDDIALHGATRHAGSPPGLAPRRTVLDTALVDAAVARGVDYRPGVSVVGVAREAGRVAGVRVRDARTGDEELRAPLVVGADGMRSAVAGAVAAATLEETPPKTCAYYAYWPAPRSTTTMRLRERSGGWVGAVETNGGEWLVGCYFPQSQFPRIRTDASAHYLACIERTAPDVAYELASAPRPDRLYGTGTQLNFVRESAGHGWALVGDAACNKDSITARGITDAFVQAELLRDCLGAPGPVATIDAGLREYSVRHPDVVVDSYRGAVSVADLCVDDTRLDLLRAVAGDASLTQRYFAMLGGSLGLEDFLTDDLLDLLPAGRQ
jgi:flavin-dependent dehydrogenase